MYKPNSSRINALVNFLEDQVPLVQRGDVSSASVAVAAPVFQVEGGCVFPPNNWAVQVVQLRHANHVQYLDFNQAEIPAGCMVRMGCVCLCSSPVAQADGGRWFW